MSRFHHYPRTIADLHNCWLQWHSLPPDRMGCRGGLRFGQWLYNNYVHDDKPWPDLFYSNDPQQAYSIALQELSGEEW